MAPRELKDPLYAQFARIGHAVASPVRLELLDLLAQGEKTVEMLAEHSTAGIKNVSAHLRVLRQARLVETRRDGTYVYYRLADGDVSRFLRDLQQLARRRLAEVEQVARQFIDDRDELEPVTLPELRRLVREGEVTVIDVRPDDEYEAGHIPGAKLVPFQDVFVDPRQQVFKSREELVAMFRGAGAAPGAAAITYCQIGMRSSLLYFAARLAGLDARNYIGSWSDWSARKLPVEPAR